MSRTPGDELQAIAVQIHALALRIRHSQGGLRSPREPLKVSKISQTGREKTTLLAGGATPRGGLDEGGQVVETPLLNGHRN